MKLVLFYHSLVSDWNHGNAHFLRGIVSELLDRGHRVEVCEPADAWSVQNLVRDHGTQPLEDFRRAFPRLRAFHYTLDSLDLDALLDGANVVLVHEWSSHELVKRIGLHHARTRSYRLYFHDTHHRALTRPSEVAAYDLSRYDGVLTYRSVLRDIYLDRGWARDAWVWPEAADTRVFHPRPRGEPEGDVVWTGSWGEELNEFLIDPVRSLGLRARVYGPRYPDEAVRTLRSANVDYRGWLPNWRVPEVFSRHRLTIHVPHRTRPFEALACAIPMVSAPWHDDDGLFTPGADYLVARNASEMRKHMHALLNDRDLVRTLTQHALQTIQTRHTCVHRVTQLLRIASTEEPRTRATEEPRAEAFA